MKKFRCAAALVLAAMLLLGLTACKSELQRAAKDLSVYTIDAQFFPDQMSLSAVQKVDYVNSSDVPLSEIKFNLFANAFREGSKFCPAQADDYPNGMSYGKIDIDNVTVSGAAVEFEVGGEDMNVLTVPLGEQLYPTARTEVIFGFSLTIPNVKHRLGQIDGVVNLGNWYPIAALYRGGGFLTDPYYPFGDPFVSECANYNITLKTPESYSVVATAPENATSADGFVTRTFTANAVRDFALVLSDKHSVVSGTTANGKTTVNYFYRSDTEPAVSLQTALDSVNTFNNMIGEYPYASLAVAETHFHSGGMEYPGLVFINAMLERPEYNKVIIHEVAHQWWYGVVGNDQVRDAWMDEALAEYTTTLFYEKNPSYSVKRQDRAMSAFRDYMTVVQVFEVIKGEINTSMNRALSEYATSTEYTCMVYVKGQLMYDSIYTLLGDATFVKCLRKYYEDNKFRIARTSDLIGAFESASGREMEGLFNSWLSGKVLITDLY